MSRSAVTRIDAKQANGRPPAESAEAVLQLDGLRQSLKELTTRYQRMTTAREDFKLMVAAVAEKTGLKPPIARAFIAARLSEHGDRAVERAKQLALVFDEIGLD